MACKLDLGGTMTSDVSQKELVGRVQAILMSPKTEWPVISYKQATISDIYTKYAIILAAIPAVAGFLKSSIIGTTLPFVGTIRVPFAGALTSAVVIYVLSLVGIFVMALIIDALAPTFGGTKNQIQALKVAVYSYTAYWVASAAQILPGIGFLIVLAGGIYSLYLLFLGLPVTMKSPPERALPYTAVTVLCAIVMGIVIGMFTAGVLGGAALVGSGAFGGLSAPNIQGQLDPSSPLGALGGLASRLEQAGSNLETAQKSGDATAQQNALGNLLGTVLGGGGNVASLPTDQIRGFVPERLGGLARTEISAERNAMLGIQISQAEATYSDGAGKSLQLEIMDLGGTTGLMAMAAWANIEQDKQTTTGYERTYKQGTRIIHEEWDNQSKHGEFSIVVGSRFTVKVTGEATSMDALKGAAAGVDLAALERLAPATAR